MQIEIRRRIRDNLYGSIDVSILEDAVISHPMFQRMRRISQTAFLNLVFPGASHTRLEHSLGVMHLAGLAWAKLKDNQERIRNYCSTYRLFEEREKERGSKPIQGLLTPSFYEIEGMFSSPYILQTLRLGALLHDLGHPPFSHSGERFLPSWESLLEENSHRAHFLKTLIKERAAKKIPVTHEIFSILMVEDMLKDIYYRHPSMILKIAAQDLVSIMVPDVEPLPQSELRKFSALHVCRELISGEIDIDRMDYLRRDAKECGVAYGFFDVDRILDSLALYSNPGDGSIHLALQYAGLPAFEDYLRARQSMYAQLYFHKTTAACEAMLQKISEYLSSWSLPVSISEYSSIDEYEIKSILQKEAKNLHKVDQLKLNTLLKDLLVNRNLWKLVYEVTEISTQASEETSKNLQIVMDRLKEERLDFELISSRNSLTRLKRIAKDKSSLNHLKLIKLDERQFLRVENIEKFTNLTEDTVQYHRIYVNREDAQEAAGYIRDLFEVK